MDEFTKTYLIPIAIPVIGGLILWIIKGSIKDFKNRLYEVPKKQEECIKKISYALSYYAGLWANPGIDSFDERKKASYEFKSLASELGAIKFTIWNKFFVIVGRSIPYVDLDFAKKNLIGLSNSFFLNPHESPSEKANRNLQMVYEIEKALKLKTGLGMDIKGIEKS